MSRGNNGSSLRKKKKNFDNMCLESSQPTVEHHKSGADSRNVFTKKKKKVTLSGVHRENVASRKAAAVVWTAAANLCQHIQEQNSKINSKKNSRIRSNSIVAWEFQNYV